MEHIEQLSLVLVDPLHLDVKHGVWVDCHSVRLHEVICKLDLIILQMLNFIMNKFQVISENIIYV